MFARERATKRNATVTVASLLLAVCSAVMGDVRPTVAQTPLEVPVLVPITGFLALEGASQRNGAVLALEEASPGLAVRPVVLDTGTTPEAAVTAFERAVGRARAPVPAIAASMLGTQMLAMMPLATEYRVPLVTVSGTASLTQMGNPWVFRFFPGDDVTKTAHARYVVEELGHRRPAIIHQTTAYGQSGREHLRAAFSALGVEPVYTEGIDTSIRDLSPVIARAEAASPDVYVLHLHAPSTVLFVRQLRGAGSAVPIVAGSALHQPSTAALLEPSELRGVCAETASSPVSGGSPEMEAFAMRYRAAFGLEPDAFAVGQFDGMRMVLDAVARGARTSEAVRDAVSTGTYRGLAMSYRSDGDGDMAHGAIIICYDGNGRTPTIVRRYGEAVRE